MIRSWFEWADALPSSIAIRESIYGWPYLLTAHAVTMALFAGLVLMMDLRMIGVAFQRTPLSQVQRQLFPWQLATLVLSAGTGAVVLYSRPLVYYGKILLWVKIALILLAGINAFIFHRFTYKSVASWDANPRPPRGARLAGALSIVLWAGVIVLGRFTAYNWFD
jgi:hypothetical protein